MFAFDESSKRMPEKEHTHLFILSRRFYHLFDRLTTKRKVASFESLTDHLQ